MSFTRSLFKIKFYQYNERIESHILYFKLSLTTCRFKIGRINDYSEEGYGRRTTLQVQRVLLYWILSLFNKTVYKTFFRGPFDDIYSNPKIFRFKHPISFFRFLVLAFGSFDCSLLLLLHVFVYVFRFMHIRKLCKLMVDLRLGDSL